MTDLSCFSNNEFKATTWINSILSESSDNESLDNFLSTMTIKLHMVAQDYSEQLETSMVESISNMPRMVNEISRLDERLQYIQKEMNSISDHIHSVDKKSVHGVEELSTFDHLKRNMENCKSILEEHARWNQVVREATYLLESGGILSETAKRVEAMYQSLVILKNLPGHEERQETCETMKLTLLNALRPTIREDVIDLKLNSLREYLFVFKTLKSEKDFEKEYLFHRPHNIKNLWMTFKTNSNESFPQWLASYLGTVAKFLFEEVEATVELFGESESSRILLLLLNETLLPMKQGLADRIKHTNNKSMIFFDIHNLLDEFSKRIFKLFTNVSKTKDIIELLKVSFETIFSGFLNTLTYYTDEKEKNLKIFTCSLFQSISIQQSKSDPVDQLVHYSESFLELNEKFISKLKESISQSLILMGGMYFKAEVKMITNLIQMYCKMMMLKMDHLFTALGIAQIMNESSTITPNNADGEDQFENFEKILSYQEEAKNAQIIFQDLQATDHDKQLLTFCVLKILQSIGNFKKKTKILEQLFKENSDTLHNKLSDSSILSFPNNLPNLISTSQSLASCYGLYLMSIDGNNLAELKSFLFTNSGNSPLYSQGVYSTILMICSKVISKSGQLTLALSLQSPIRQLSNYAIEEVWTRKDILDPENKDNLLPLSIITQVGEHFLSWVQDLESFASSDVIEDLLIGRSEIRGLCLNSIGWQQLKGFFNLSDNKSLDLLINRPSSNSLMMTFAREISFISRSHNINLGPYLESLESSLISLGSDTEETNSEYSSINPSNRLLAFVNDWLCSIFDSVLGLLICQITKMTHLSPYGSAQLSVDLEYLNNIIIAMGIKPHPLMLLLRFALLENPDSLIKCLNILNMGRITGALGGLSKIAIFISNSRVHSSK